MCVSEEEGEAVAVGRGLISTDSMQILTILTDRIQVKIRFDSQTFLLGFEFFQ